jgi:sulfite exporter TauE/SafE
MMGLLAAAFGAGLLGGVHCLGMCGGFATACARTRGGLPLWHIGRVTTYMGLGAFAATAGRMLPGPAWVPALIASLLLVWFCLALSGLAPELKLHPNFLARHGAATLSSPGAGAQLIFGLLNGLIPCGLVYAALAVPVALADPWRGALAMGAFGLGTVPLLSAAALGLRRLLMARLWHRRVLAALILATGLWTVWNRATGPGHMAHLADTPAGTPVQQHPDPGAE